MTNAQIRAAAIRLALDHKSPHTMTMREYEEATLCEGSCTANYERGIRIVRTHPGCPVHTQGSSHADH